MFHAFYCGSENLLFSYLLLFSLFDPVENIVQKIITFYSATSINFYFRMLGSWTCHTTVMPGQISKQSLNNIAVKTKMIETSSQKKMIETCMEV